MFPKGISIDSLNQFHENSMVNHLGIKLTEIGEDYLKGTMPVDHRTVQPFGLLHGGASVALAETLGSLAATLLVDRDKFACVGLDINANHIRSVSEGVITGIARALHIGRSTQVWEIKILTEEGKLVCISRITIAVIQKT